MLSVFPKTAGTIRTFSVDIGMELVLPAITHYPVQVFVSYCSWYTYEMNIIFCQFVPFLHNTCKCMFWIWAFLNCISPTSILGKS